MTLVDVDGGLLTALLADSSAPTPEEAIERAIWLSIALENPEEILAEVSPADVGVAAAAVSVDAEPLTEERGQ